MEYYNRHPAEYDILAAVYKIEVKGVGNQPVYQPPTEQQVINDFTALCAFAGKPPGKMPEPVKDHIRWAEEQVKRLNAGLGFEKHAN